VHRWLLRHVYFPALRTGFTKLQATILIFFGSAVFHEVSLPYLIVGGISFFAVVTLVTFCFLQFGYGVAVFAVFAVFAIVDVIAIVVVVVVVVVLLLCCFCGSCCCCCCLWWS